MSAGCVSIDGKLTAPDEARVSVFDRGFLYGDAVFTTLRVYAGRPLLLDRHLERIFASAARFGIAAGLERATLAREVAGAVAHAGLADAFLRITLTRGAGGFGLLPSPATAATRIVAVLPLPPGIEEQRARGLSVQTRRVQHVCLGPGEKTPYYLPQILALAEARAHGVQDVLFVDGDDRLLEATTANVFVLVGETWCTPPLATGIFDGMTRRVLLSALEGRGREQALCRADLARARAVALTSSVREIMSVAQVDERSFDQHALLAVHELQRLYRATLERGA